MLKSALLITTSLSVCACTHLPPTPRHTQYGVHADVNPPGFYGVDSKTKDRIYRPFNDPAMKGGQCLTNADFKAWLNWIRAAQKISEERCK